MRSLFTILTLVCALVSVAGQARAQTVLPGGVLSDANLHWTKANSPYHLPAKVVVPEGKTLFVDSGVQVLAARLVRLEVRGALQVGGGEANGFTVFGALDPEVGWSGIELTRSAGPSTISGAYIIDSSWVGVVSNAERLDIEVCGFGGNAKVQIAAGTPLYVTHSIFANSETGIHISGGGTLELRNSLLRLMHVGVLFDAEYGATDSRITHTTFDSLVGVMAGTKSGALYVDVRQDDAATILFENSIVSNSDVGITRTDRPGSKVRVVASMANLWRVDSPLVGDVVERGPTLNVDPGYVDPEGGNFHLSSQSPLIDAGTNPGDVSSDLGFAVRPQGSGYDIGAYEFTSAGQCGDGIVDSGEQCDDGNASNWDECMTNCAVASCGDNFVNQASEVCDDGNLRTGDGCSDMCTVEEPGPGITETDSGGCAVATSPTPLGAAFVLLALVMLTNRRSRA